MTIRKRKKSIFKEFNINKIIKQQMTTRSDLEFLANKLGLDDVKINWLKDYKDYKGPQILNLGNPTIGGSHWICIYNNKYFDPFGLIPPPQLNHLEWTPLQIQNPNAGYCGTYCVLYLYYAKIGELDRFYNLFQNLNTI